MGRHFLLLQRLIIIAICCTASISSQAQAFPPEFFTSSEYPAYIQNWKWRSTEYDASGNGSFMVRDSMDFNPQIFVSEVDAMGEVTLPAWAGAYSHMFVDTNVEQVWNTYKVIDRWNATVFNDPNNAWIESEVFTFITEGGFGAAVVSDTETLIWWTQEFWNGPNRIQLSYLLHHVDIVVSDVPGFSMARMGACNSVELSDLLPELFEEAETAGLPAPSMTGGCGADCAAGFAAGTAASPAPLGMPAAESQLIHAFNIGFAYTPGVQELLPTGMTLATHSTLFTALANAISLPGAGMVFRNKMTLDVTSDVVLNPDTVGNQGSARNVIALRMDSLETILMGEPEFDYEPLDLGQSFFYGGGGVAQGSTACSSGGDRFRGLTRMNSLFNPFWIQTFIHEANHQFSAKHTFNANNTNDEGTPSQRVASSAFEAGSGSSMMSYSHNCQEVQLITSDDDEEGTLVEFNHRVLEPVADRVHKYSPFKYVEAFKNTYHTHSLEQIESHIQANCNSNFYISVAPIPEIAYERGTETANVNGVKLVPNNKPFMLSVVPEEHTRYAWNQMNLGMPHLAPDTLAMGTVVNSFGASDLDAPRFSAGVPTEDGVRFFPGRDELFFNRNQDYQNAPLPIFLNSATPLKFRAGATRFIPMSDLGTGNLAGGLYHHSYTVDNQIVEVAVSMSGTGFGWVEGPWDGGTGWSNTLIASQEIGEDVPFFQGIGTWYSGGTHNAPFNSATAEIIKVTKFPDRIEMETMYEAVPNEAFSQLVLNLLPTPMDEDGILTLQYLLIRPEGQIFFDQSPPFRVDHYGCTNPLYSSYDPYANQHDQSDCYMELPEITEAPSDCKDLNACNY